MKIIHCWRIGWQTNQEAFTEKLQVKCSELLLWDHHSFIATVESHCFAQLLSNYGKHVEHWGGRCSGGEKNGRPGNVKLRTNATKED